MLHIMLKRHTNMCLLKQYRKLMKGFTAQYIIHIYIYIYIHKRCKVCNKKSKKCYPCIHNKIMQGKGIRFKFRSSCEQLRKI